MPALYSHTTRANGTVLTATIYNGDHQNHIDNGVPAQHDDYSVNVGQMQSQVSPGGVGTESLATSTAGELERLRYVIAQMRNATFWYSPDGRHALIGVQVFTASGTYNSSTGARSIIVEGLGGGGGGGGCATQGSGSACTSPGGSAGAFARARYTSGFTGGITVTIGGGGAGGTAGVNAGANGGTTSFGTLMTCPGGNGGSGNTGSTGNAFIGAAAASASPTITGGTSLGSAPGSAGVGGIQLAGGSNAQGGGGGASHYGGAAAVVIANGTNLSFNGNSGVGFGCGGGGGVNTSTSAAAAGGAGVAGLCVIYEFS